MGVDAGMPLGLMERVRKIVGEELARFARSGFLRNATISDGGLSIRGGFLRLISGAFNLFYVGPITPNAPDGTPQQGVRIRRADGTIALHTWDAFPGADGTFNQALTWLDRAGSTVIADDTDSGQGIARPWIPGVWEYARSLDWPAVTSTSFETVYRAKMPKQHPRLRAAVWGWNDTAGATGEIQVWVNGVQLGATVTTGNSGVGEFLFGPSPVDEVHMGELQVEVRARLVSGAGGVRCCPSTPPEGRQS